MSMHGISAASKGVLGIVNLAKRALANAHQQVCADTKANSAAALSLTPYGRKGKHGSAQVAA